MKTNEIVIILDTPIESSYMPVETLSTQVRVIFSEDIVEDKMETRNVAASLVLIPYSLNDMDEIEEKCFTWANNAVRKYARATESYCGEVRYY